MCKFYLIGGFTVNRPAMMFTGGFNPMFKLEVSSYPKALCVSKATDPDTNITYFLSEHGSCLFIMPVEGDTKELYDDYVIQGAKYKSVYETLIKSITGYLGQCLKDVDWCMPVTQSDKESITHSVVRIVSDIYEQTQMNAALFHAALTYQIRYDLYKVQHVDDYCDEDREIKLLEYLKALVMPNLFLVNVDEIEWHEEFWDTWNLTDSIIVMLRTSGWW